MNKERDINKLIAEGCDTNQISDGYHTFGELYEHRIALFIALCRKLVEFGGDVAGVWRAVAHSDGSVLEGWFLLGIGRERGDQITYHLPMSKWDETGFARDIEKAPAYDGHTSDDVLLRLRQL